MKVFQVLVKNKIGKTMAIEIEAGDADQARLNCKAAELVVLDMDTGVLSPLTRFIYAGVALVGLGLLAYGMSLNGEFVPGLILLGMFFGPYLLVCWLVSKLAVKKGGSQGVLFLICVVTTPLIGLVVALLMPYKKGDVAGKSKICPYCKEQIKKQAVLCRFCNSDLAAG